VEKGICELWICDWKRKGAFSLKPALKELGFEKACEVADGDSRLGRSGAAYRKLDRESKIFEKVEEAALGFMPLAFA
jgi:hypothetical protein